MFALSGIVTPLLFSSSKEHTHSSYEDNQMKALPVEKFKQNLSKIKSHPGAKGKFGLPLTLQYRGLIDLQRLYKFMVLWMKERSFEFYEKTHRFRSPEFSSIWEAERKKNAFILEKIHIELQAVGDHKVEVTEKGKKKLMFKGRLVIKFDGEIAAPYESITGELPWNRKRQRWLLDKFMRFINRQDILFAEDDLYYMIVTFAKDVKEQLGMEVR